MAADWRELQWQQIEQLLQVVAPGYRLRPAPPAAPAWLVDLEELADRVEAASAGLTRSTHLTVIQGGRA